MGGGEERENGKREEEDGEKEGMVDRWKERMKRGGEERRGELPNCDFSQMFHPPIRSLIRYPPS